MTIEQMNLEPNVEEKARLLQKSAPGVIFTSGRRTLTDQARAMAQNVVRVRDYIYKTYVPSTAEVRCQAWVDSNPHATSVDALTNGLLSVLIHLSAAQAARLSKHLSGRAFDIAPHSATIAQVIALKPALFLQHEAGLERWHLQW